MSWGAGERPWPDGTTSFCRDMLDRILPFAGGSMGSRQASTADEIAASGSPGIIRWPGVGSGLLADVEGDQKGGKAKVPKGPFDQKCVQG